MVSGYQTRVTNQCYSNIGWVRRKPDTGEIHNIFLKEMLL
jgi:hypothetical protein